MTGEIVTYMYVMSMVTWAVVIFSRVSRSDIDNIVREAVREAVTDALDAREDD